MATVSFIIACKRFFGLKPGQGLTDFNQEVKALTPKDRGELSEMLAVELGEPVGM
jgi:hypothetical protein